MEVSAVGMAEDENIAVHRTADIVADSEGMTAVAFAVGKKNTAVAAAVLAVAGKVGMSLRVAEDQVVLSEAFEDLRVVAGLAVLHSSVEAH